MGKNLKNMQENIAHTIQVDGGRNNFRWQKILWGSLLNNLVEGEQFKKLIKIDSPDKLRKDEFGKFTT